MYDRPHVDELIAAARLHMEQTIIPAVQGDAKLYFQTLVAINVLKIAERDLEFGQVHARAEWHGLDVLNLSSDQALMPTELKALRAGLAQRNQALAQAVRRGEYDDKERWESLFAHVKVTTIAQLEVANPRFLKTLAAEDGGFRTADSTLTHPKVEP